VAREIESLSHGESIGLVGFSAGGALAARLAGVEALHVKAALDYYGPPDFRDYLEYHGDDRFVQYFAGRVHFSPSFIALMSGPYHSSAYVVGAFGLYDQNVVASVSTASFERDHFHGKVYDYPGPHGVSIDASPPALRDFLMHLKQT
jgi:dienelactone hydrolase